MTKEEILSKDRYDFEDFKAIVEYLRAPDGCPWDREQTHESMKQNLIEECYEVIEAIDNKDTDNLKEELGDVLLQVVMHSQISKENQEFAIEDVVNGVAEKLVRRHPHVFGTEGAAENAAAGLSRWESIKKEEKKGKSDALTPLKSVPKAFPACVRAQKVLKKASKEYGNSQNADEVIKDLKNTLDRLEKNGKNTDDLQNLLLQSVNLTRILEENAENILTNGVEKFISMYE